MLASARHEKEVGVFGFAHITEYSIDLSQAILGRTSTILMILSYRPIAGQSGDMHRHIVPRRYGLHAHRLNPPLEVSDGPTFGGDFLPAMASIPPMQGSLELFPERGGDQMPSLCRKWGTSLVNPTQYPGSTGHLPKITLSRRNRGKAKPDERMGEDRRIRCYPTHSPHRSWPRRRWRTPAVKRRKTDSWSRGIDFTHLRH
jgi:hypothetical protein